MVRGHTESLRARTVVGRLEMLPILIIEMAL